MIRTEYNALTGETLEVVLTEKEVLARLKDEAEVAAEKEAKQAEAEAKATQKAALLDRLGITEAEARLLLG
jgi:hypothetical protein